jgi:hypothetical protein
MRKPCITLTEMRMSFLDSVRRWSGWIFLALVAALVTMGYHFGNVRFLPLAAGFGILAALCLIERGRIPMRSDGIHPRRDSGVSRASG